MAITLREIMKRLNDEGYENCHQHPMQIIVNNRGEIDEGFDGKWEVHSRMDNENHLRPATGDIDLLFKYIAYAWPKKEPK